MNAHGRWKKDILMEHINGYLLALTMLVLLYFIVTL